MASNIDPSDFPQMSKEELVELIVNTNHEIEDQQAMVSEAKAFLFDLIRGNGEIIGHYSVVKAKRINFQLSLFEAKELGAVKEDVDHSILKKLYDKGAEIKHTVTKYLLIKAVESKEDDNPVV